METIESEMKEREILFYDAPRFRDKGTRDILQAEKTKAVQAVINGIERFKSMVSVLNCHRNCKTPLLYALTYHCLQRCYFSHQWDCGLVGLMI